jgi:hypothetical protein
VKPGLFETGLRTYRKAAPKTPRLLLKHVYAPYIRAYREASREVAAVRDADPAVTPAFDILRGKSGRSLIPLVRKAFGARLNVPRGDYMVAIGDRVIY